VSEADLRPTVFVVMPYGTKIDPRTGLEVDFDRIFNDAFKPAAKRARVEAIRADEERIGGFVHLAMFERLLLAEIVLADLTLMSPNVMYELGIRHATRPRSTISVFASIGQLPFDLSPIRAVPYRLDTAGKLTPSSRRALVTELTKRLTGALTETAADSPLFQLITSYPGVTLPHDVTETFQQRVRALTQLSTRIRSAPSRLSAADALAELRELAQRLIPEAGTPTDLVIDLLLAYRDVEAFDDMVQLIEVLRPEIRDHPSVRQLLGFALNRRNQPGDDERAIEVLERLIDKHGVSPETLGLLGRVHKQRHEKYRDIDPARAAVALDAAISAYEKGFRVDMRDFYPGVNAVTLLLLKGSEESYARARQLSPVVAFAVAGRGGLDSNRYWDVAAVLELAVVNMDRATAVAAARRLRYRAGPPWRFRTTAENLERLLEALERRGNSLPWLRDLIDDLMRAGR
jgi:MAP3K TRAFs-binding domain